MVLSLVNKNKLETDLKRKPEKHFICTSQQRPRIGRWRMGRERAMPWWWRLASRRQRMGEWVEPRGRVGRPRALGDILPRLC